MANKAMLLHVLVAGLLGAAMAIGVLRLGGPFWLALVVCLVVSSGLGAMVRWKLARRG